MSVDNICRERKNKHFGKNVIQIGQVGPKKVVKFGCLRGFLTISREICTYFVRLFVIAPCAISEMFNFEKILPFTSDRVRDEWINDISRRKCLTMATKSLRPLTY